MWFQKRRFKRQQPICHIFVLPINKNNKHSRGQSIEQSYQVSFQLAAALCFQKRRFKNRQHPFPHLWASCVLCIAYQRQNCLEDHPMNIPTKFCSNWPHVVSEKIKNRQLPICPLWVFCFFCVILINTKLLGGPSNEHFYHV